MKAFVGTQRQSRARCGHQQTSCSSHRPAEENRRYADVARRSGILLQAFVWFPRKENLWVIQTSDKLDTVIKINHSENAAQMPFPALGWIPEKFVLFFPIQSQWERPPHWKKCVLTSEASHSAVVIIKGRQTHIRHTQTYHTTQKWCLPASCLPMFSSSFEKRGSPSSRPVCPTALPPLAAFRSASQTAWRLLARTERRESHIRRGTLQLALCVIFTYNWKYLSYICWGGGGGKEAIIILWAVEKLKKATASED